MNDDKNGRYIVLDGMRGIAALAVMIFHYTSHYNYQIFSNAPVAVDLFFILSGFVLSFSYSDKILERRIGFIDFILRRIIRLYPLFIVGLVWGSIDLCLFRKLGQTTYSLHEVVAAFFYNGLFLPFANNGSTHIFERPYASLGAIFPANGVAWSLFCEMFVNLFFFQLIRMTKSALSITATASLVLLVALSFATTFATYGYTASIDVGWCTTNFLPGLARVFFGFTLGILIQKSLPDISESKRKILALFARYPLLLYIVLAALFLIPFHFHGLVSVISITLICPALVLSGAYAKAQNNLFLATSRFLGWISYPVYCLHIPIGNLISIVNNEGGVSVFFPLPLAISASLITIIVSVILTKFYEEPLRFYLTLKMKPWLQKLPLV